jgi:hypothetical protein
MMAVDAMKKIKMIESVRDCLEIAFTPHEYLSGADILTGFAIWQNDPVKRAHVVGMEIQFRLQRDYGIKFVDCDTWMALLVEKWRSKTPDLSAQADGILNAILKQLRKL